MRFYLVLCVLAAMGCKENVLDKGPAFKLSSPELEATDFRDGVISLNRDDLSQGPSFKINVEKWGDIKETNKKLVCDGFEIPGKKVLAPDVSLFHFKLSETDFPTLGVLPMTTQCKLRVGLRNNNGSLVERDYPLNISFNKPPRFNITKTSAQTGSWVTQNLPQLILLERYSIQNTFPYTLSLTYFGLEFSCAVTPPSSTGGYTLPVKTLATRLILSGNYVNPEGDYFSRVSFQVLPGETAQLEVFGGVSSEVQTPPAKIQLAQCNQTASLAVWRDVKFSAEDKASPLRLSLP